MATYADVALSAAKKRFGNGQTPADGSQGNAFQHCVWMALEAHAYGDAIALTLGRKHEEFNPSNSNTELHKQMDLHNNTVGALVGVYLDASPYRFAIGAYEDYLCNRALVDGELQKLATVDGVLKRVRTGSKRANETTSTEVYIQGLVDDITPAIPTRTTPAPGDFDDDKRADPGVWNGAGNGDWNIARSSSGNVRVPAWGGSSHWAVPADYDGDGQTDVAVWNKTNGQWGIIQSRYGGSHRWVNAWGNSSQWPVPADYNGDGSADPAVMDPNQNFWAATLSGGAGELWLPNFGNTSEVPVPGNWDSATDKAHEAGVFNPDGHYWAYKDPAQPNVAVFVVNSFGSRPEWAVSGNYLGDARMDPAVWNPVDEDWWIAPTGGGTNKHIAGWGGSGDWAVPADYDGDGKDDVTIFDRADSYWGIIQSSNGANRWVWNWGSSPEVPITGRPVCATCSSTQVRG